MDNEDLYDEFGNYIGPDPDDDQDDDEVRACVRAWFPGVPPNGL